MENEIKVGEYCRTKYGEIGKITETFPRLKWRKKKASSDLEYNLIQKHSPNLKDIIQKNDFVNKCRVYEVEEKGITVYQTVENSATDYNWISFDEIEEIVTKEMMESISYKVK